MSKIKVRGFDVSSIRVWKRARRKADILNSLTDAFIDLPVGCNLLYYEGLPFKCETEVLHAAANVASRHGGALVRGPVCGPEIAFRRWRYMIQKPEISAKY